MAQSCLTLKRHPRKPGTWVFTLAHALRDKVEDLKTSIRLIDANAQVEDFYDSNPEVHVRPTKPIEDLAEMAIAFEASHAASVNPTFVTA